MGKWAKLAHSSWEVGLEDLGTVPDLPQLGLGVISPWQTQLAAYQIFTLFLPLTLETSFCPEQQYIQLKILTPQDSLAARADTSFF